MSQLSTDNTSNNIISHPSNLISHYLGISFAVFLAFLPQNSIPYVSSLQSRNRILAMKLFEAEDELRQLRSRRKEDAKANARVAEIFSGHRNRWQQEHRRLVQRLEAADEEIGALRAEVERLEREVKERDEMLDFVAKKVEHEEEEEVVVVVEDENLQYNALQSKYEGKHFVARRESPWKVDSESSGVSSKLKLLEQELGNLENIGQANASKIPSLMRKQAKRYKSLVGKIEDLCQRMQVKESCDATLSPEFRKQQLTEFLLEAFRLHHRATETRQKLTALQTETISGDLGSELTLQAKLNARRSFDSMKNNFREIQRNLEIWLARIMGDLEGILVRDGASRVKDYYVSPYPLVR